MYSVKTHDVIIAGAGPVGLVAAFALAEAGLNVLVLEAQASCAEDLRASTLHPPTLEMLDELGILTELLPQGLRAPVYQYRIRATGEVLAFDLSELADIARFPFRLQCEQYKLARLLAAKLAAHACGEVLFGRRVVHFEQDDGGVIVRAEAAQAIETYSARFLIAADGANSIVRKWLDVGFSGFTYPEKFLTLSTGWPIEAHFDQLAYVNYVADPDEWNVLLRVPTLWRVLVPSPEDTPDAVLRSDETKNAVFGRLIGEPAAVETRHRTVYRVHQRVADRYNHGRVLLIGDAAHLNNPLGGFGMNSGIHDAVALVEQLKPILIDDADPAPRLERFDRQRRAVMHGFIQAQTVRNKRALEAGIDEQRRFQGEMRIICADPERRRAYMYTQAMFESLDQAKAA